MNGGMGSAPTMKTGWAAALDAFADRIALVPEDGPPLSYAALMRAADAFAARLDPSAPPAIRRLVLLGVRNDVASIAAYLGCLRAGHPVLLLAAGEPHDRITAAFQPDATWDAESDALTLAEAPGGGLNPDLALLLSTSGSTGAPKLVRLAHAAVAANAASIIQYLGIGQEDRAVTTLPFHYSYGLSVLNSHLMAGASIALTDLSVAHPDFAALLVRTAPTSLAGVPYTHELLAKTGLVERLPTSVRTLTQAGGRLAPEKVLALARLGQQRGFSFVPMYGQTEATARMAWLPPGQVEAHPDCIGRAIPGGAFRLIDADGVTIDTAGTPGELVYTGPNVMMGYGFTRADLGRGPELSELRTGDIAERTSDGLYRIVGRASRFAKIAGLRIGFDDVEALLREAGTEATVTGSDALLVLHVSSGPPGMAAARVAAMVAAMVAERAHIPEAAVIAVEGELPRLPSGKVDYGAIRTAGEAAATARAASLSRGVHPILAGYRRAFNAPSLGGDASFQGMGGDSLAYINAAIAIEKSLGALPPRWEEMPVSALIALDSGGPLTAAPRPRWTAMGTDTIFRVWALALVIIGHAAPQQTEFLRGGAAILMLLAGWSFARFQRTAFERGEPWPVVRGSLERMILPYYCVMIPLLFLSQADRSWGWFALVSVYTVEYRGPLFAFWFIETVFHALILMVVLYAFPPLRRFSAARPFETGLLLLLLAVGLKFGVPALMDDPAGFTHRVDGHFYLYVLGFLVVAAGTTPRRLLVLALGVALAALDYGPGSARALWLAAGLAALLLLPAISVPGRFAGPFLRIAAASYFIYVIHVPLHHITHFELGLTDKPFINIPLSLLLSLSGGLIFEALWSRAMLALKSRTTSRARPTDIAA